MTIFIELFVTKKKKKKNQQKSLKIHYVYKKAGKNGHKSHKIFTL
jgi:hypothetical protein